MSVYWLNIEGRNEGIYPTQISETTEFGTDYLRKCLDPSMVMLVIGYIESKMTIKTRASILHSCWNDSIMVNITISNNRIYTISMGETRVNA